MALLGNLNEEGRCKMDNKKRNVRVESDGSRSAPRSSLAGVTADHGTPETRKHHLPLYCQL